MKYLLPFLTCLIIVTSARAEDWQHIFGATYTCSLTSSGDDLWIGTQFDGLIRYNPKTGIKENYGHPFMNCDYCPPISSIAFDSKGTLLMISRNFNNETTLLSFKDGNWKVLTEPNIRPYNNVKFYIDGQDNVWLYGNLGLRKYGSDFKLIKSYTSNTVNSLDIKNGTIRWAATNKGLYKLNSDQLEFNDEFGIGTNPISGFYYSDNDGLYYLVGINKKIIVRNKDKSFYLEYETTKNGSTEISCDIHFITPDGTLWTAGTYNLCRFKGSSFVKMEYDWSCSGSTCVNPLYCYEFRGYYIAPDNTVWLASHPGITCYEDGIFKGYKIGDGLIENNITEILTDRKNRVWIAQFCPYPNRENSSGISCIENGIIRNYPEDLHPTLAYPYCIALDSSGNIWIGTNSCVIRFDTEKEEFRDYLAGVFVNDICVDLNNNIWVATNGKKSPVYRFDGSNWKQYSMTDMKATSGDCNVIKTDPNNNIWIGTKNEIIRFSRETDQFELFKHDWPFKMLQDMNYDKNNNIWLVLSNEAYGDWSSIVRYQEQDKNWIVMKTAPGNSSGSTTLINAFKKIEFDSKNNAWIILYYDGIFKFNENEEKVYNLDNSQLISNAFNGFAVDRNDNIIAGNSYGVVIYNEDKITGLSTTDVNEGTFSVETEYHTAAYPIPATDNITVAFYTDKPEPTIISISDVNGRNILTLFDGYSTEGQNVIKSEIGNLPSGSYFYRVRTGSYEETRPFVVMK